MKAIKYILSKKAGITVLVLLLLSAGYIIFSVSKPHTFHEGDTITAEEMNENFDALYAKVTELEAIIDNPIMGNVPAGTILPFGGDVDKIPEGWLLCDGSPYSGYEYPDLYEVIGTNFGSVGGTVFNVPDLRGMFLRGVDNGADNDPDVGTRTPNGDGETDAPGSRQEDAFQGHKHVLGIYEKWAAGGTDRPAPHDGGYPSTKWSRNEIAGNGHGDPRESIETRPKNVAVHFIIKY